MNDFPQDRLRSISTSRQLPLQLRANQLAKKLGAFTSRLGGRGKLKDSLDIGSEPYRQMQSMDVGRKPFMSQPILTLNLDRSASPGESSSNGMDTPGDARKLSLSLERHDESDGLALSQFSWERQDNGQPGYPADGPSTSSQSGPDAPLGLSGSQELSSSTNCRHSASSPSLSTMSSQVSYIVPTPSVATRQSKRPTVPRLASLPPLTTVHLMETADHRVRLSPTIVMRRPPHPILNLPSLPPPTPTGETHAPRRPHLSTMPCLPMEGTDEHEDDPDLEHADLGEEDDEDGDDYEELEMSGRGAASGLGSDDDEAVEDAVPLSFIGRASGNQSQISTPRLLDFRVPTSNSSVLVQSDHTDSSNSLSSLGRSESSAATPIPGSADAGFDTNEGDLNVATPKAYRNEYFSSVAVGGTTTDDQRTPSTSTEKPFKQIPPLLSRPQRGEASLSKRPQLSMGQSPVVPSFALDGVSSRPGLYHQASKSMINLFSTPREPETIEHRSSRVFGGVDAKGKGKDAEQQSLRDSSQQSSKGGDAALRATNIDADVAPGPSQEASTSTAPASNLRRQRSMPTFKASGPPPPYPTFLPEYLQRIKPSPRDEEGREQLPSYSNDIKLVAIMPRKMEFNAPGLHAKDRKWRRVHCVLEGTSFRVYRCPPSVSGVGVIGGWWEKKVGVGDVALVNGNVGNASPTTKKTTASVKWEQEQQSMSDTVGSSSRESAEPVPVIVPPPKSKRHITAAFLHPSRSRISLGGSPSRSSSLTPSPVSSPINTPRSSIQLPRPSTDSSSASSSLHSRGYMSTSSSTQSSSTYIASSSSSSLSGVRSHTRSQSRTNSSGASLTLPEPNPKDLMHEYTLQNAESGLASDYFKRKNVIRVRMEGEQFLLQATDIAGVIEWIEGLQAATNIALDLDVRPMPKGPIFPRRRRRRRVRITADEPQIGVQITDPS